MYFQILTIYNSNVFTFGIRAIRVFVSALKGQHGTERSE
jgi:hypothetical protein